MYKTLVKIFNCQIFQVHNIQDYQYFAQVRFKEIVHILLFRPKWNSPIVHTIPKRFVLNVTFALRQKHERNARLAQYNAYGMWTNYKVVI